ncbi:MAG: hypothetical protein IKP19_09335, partial [Oscillospiraceae bacterium]|nr:hypothetical protein [Oscillospiraceae bacterium]
FVVVLAGRQARLRPPPRLAQFPLGTLSNPSIKYQYKKAAARAGSRFFRFVMIRYQALPAQPRTSISL